MTSYPSTLRFSVSKDPAHLNIEGEPDRILDVWYRATPDAEPRHFGHAWDIRDSHPMMADVNGKWTFNRSDVPIANEWWPAEYHHETLAALIQHLEDTFVEATRSCLFAGPSSPACLSPVLVTSNM